jgi:SAM-dependent methyltransferase
MEQKSYKKLSRDIGLEIGSVLGKYFLQLEHLHYGYWTPDLEVNIANLSKAQHRYTEFLLAHVPGEARTVLDVGCGTGATARRLVEAGYRVDCLSPSHFQCEKVRELLGNAGQVFECEFEKLETQNRYDVILFSESFQYVNLYDGLAQSVRLLNDGGYLLISDIFRKPVTDQGLIKGGHDLNLFYEAVASHPFRLIEDIDITEATAPNIDLENDVMTNVVQPVLRLANEYVDARYSLASKVVKWLYRRQIKRKYDKYFGGGRTGEEFKRTRSYRLLLYKKL